jgi:hypothetical protein
LVLRRAFVFAKQSTPKKTGKEIMIKRGDKISAIGEDSVFEGFFIAAFEKLPMDYNGEGYNGSDKWRSIVQQKDGTGIVLIKGSPDKLQKGWRSEAPDRTYVLTRKRHIGFFTEVDSIICNEKNFEGFIKNGWNLDMALTEEMRKNSNGNS